ncbi:MAG: HD domain-containing protein [Planctomycetota bacterium]
MEQRQLEKFSAWFDDYVAGFYGDEEAVNVNLKLKEEHSRRVCEEMLYLVEELDLADNQKRIAEVIALFHDIGRFVQFIKYRTYSDVRSVNHCLLGLKVLREAKVFEAVERKERQLIEKAIEYHGRKELPRGLDGECLLFSKLIRDADKADALYVITEYYRQYRDNPQEFMLELDFPDEQGYSAEVVEEILRGRQIDYGEVRTLNDAKLLQLGWVYDVNFRATLKRIMQRGILEMLLCFLPETRDIERVKEKIFEYVDFRIKQGG